MNNKHGIDTRFSIRPAHMALLLMVLVAASGCRGALPVERMPRMRWLVTSIVSETTPTRDIHGWWFGARTIRMNPRAGASLSETISQALASHTFINQYSPIDLRYYFADKREMLGKAYPQLGDAEIDDLLSKVPPVRFARELGADKLVTGRIERNHLGENRTIHWWWSVLDAEIQVVDVRTGTVEWTRRYHYWKNFASPEDLQQRMAQRFVKDLDKSYFPTLVR